MDSQSAELTLKVGDTLQLQFYPGNEDDRHYVRLIGYLPGKSILVTTPRINNQSLLVKEGQGFVARLLAGKEAHGFTTTVLKAAYAPYPYLHLSYPNELKSIVVRKAQRINANIIVSVQNEEPSKSFDEPKSATIVDISAAGALMRATTALGEIGDTINITTRITVGDVEQYLNIQAIVRRCRGEPEDDPDTFNHGLEFENLDEQAKLVIHGFVYEQLAKERT